MTVCGWHGVLTLLVYCRVLDICDIRDGVLRLHDLQNLAHLWKEKPAGLPQHLLPCGIRIGHGHQGLRYRSETDLCRKQPIHPRLDLRLYDHHGCLHSDANELLQQGA